MSRRSPAVALAVLLLASVGCSSPTPKVTGAVTASGPASAQQATIAMTDALTFVPNVVHATVGRLTLTVENEGLVPHNLVFADGALGGTDMVAGHVTVTLTVPLTKPGTYRFTCTVHPRMDGTLVVST